MEATVLAASVKIECDKESGCECMMRFSGVMYDALFTPEICLSNDILEFRGTPNLDIDD